MTRRGILLAALAIVGLAGIGQDGSAYAAELPLTPGWDVCEAGGGRVHYNVSPGKLHITFHLNGAKPKTTYRFGIGVFKPQVSAFGGLLKYGAWQEFTRTDCGPKQITKTGTHQTFIFGTVETNSAGNASLGKQLRVGKGTYTLQFAVSGHNDDRAFFKSGNSYADTVTVTIP